jgi:hypothetical protein
MAQLVSRVRFPQNAKGFFSLKISFLCLRDSHPWFEARLLSGSIPGPVEIPLNNLDSHRVGLEFNLGST